MKSQDRIVAVVIFLSLLVLWLGFTLHRSPLFAGSFWGGAIGISAAVFMLIPLVYTLVKRSARLRRAFTKNHALQTLLQAHIYFGLVGALLGIIHSGHRFESALGIALTASMLLSVVSGFIGQYYLRYVAENIRENKTRLGGLWRSMEWQGRAFAQGPLEPPVMAQAVAEWLPLVSATADLQYTVEFQEKVRRLFNSWLTIHIVCSIAFYLLLALHIWAGVYFGLRWFR